MDVFKSLRRRYLNLLLVHPTAKESKDVENHLWMQTSYAFISSYKQRIAALDRVIQNNQRQQQQQPQRQNNHGPVEYRKLTQRFRQFLADEDRFWTQLILRLYRLFDLHEAQPALYAIGILGRTDDVVPPISATEGPMVEIRDGVMHGSNGRNHFQFPPEDPAVSFAPTTPEERAARMAILTKALICLGDIARYRELYNESGGRSKAGHEDGGSSRRGRSRRGGAAAEAFPRQRTYEKAQLCYEQARLLVPYEGNPSHQLAILASYKKDSFASLVHYYHALCVRQPYDTAAENLATVLSKALDLWRQRTRRGEKHVDTPLPPRVRIEAFKEKVIVLHALWRVGLDKGIEK
jgi:protein SMG7